MARNAVQFQKGISLNEFLSLYNGSTAPKTNALTPCFNGDGPMGFCALTVTMTAAANSTAANSNSAIAAIARPRLPQALSSAPPSCP